MLVWEQVCWSPEHTKLARERSRWAEPGTLLPQERSCCPSPVAVCFQSTSGKLLCSEGILALKALSYDPHVQPDLSRALH